MGAQIVKLILDILAKGNQVNVKVFVAMELKQKLQTLSIVMTIIQIQTMDVIRIVSLNLIIFVKEQIHQFVLNARTEFKKLLKFVMTLTEQTITDVIQIVNPFLLAGYVQSEGEFARKTVETVQLQETNTVMIEKQDVQMIVYLKNQAGFVLSLFQANEFRVILFVATESLFSLLKPVMIQIQTLTMVVIQIVKMKLVGTVLIFLQIVQKFAETVQQLETKYVTISVLAVKRIAEI